jgi:drug/metabolite transporter (DMT)-like permease
MRVDSRTVTVAAAGVLLTAALGALTGKSVGVAAGILAALVSLVGSAVVTVILERHSRQAAAAVRNQELLDMFAPPEPLAGREEEE